MTNEEKLNLAEGKEKATAVVSEFMEKAQGFFLVLGIDTGENLSIAGALGGVMDDDLPRKVLAKAVTLTLAIEGKIPFPEAVKEGNEDAPV